MSIQKHEYELSVWSETLGQNGQKIEKKEYIIGAHDMTYLGRATDIKFETKLNGTHTLTFQMPDRYFNSEKGGYVRNEFVNNLFNEKKIKLKFMDEWYEFYIKTISDQKQYKSYMKKYTCTDAFIEELSRNGYGITFDTELYNNVEEMGTFSRIILEDSIWNYTPQYNWGDFTEFLEEKLFKIPVGKDLFPSFVGHKVYYNISNTDKKIINAFTGKTRPMELGDDLAAAINGKGGYFWDNYDGTMPLLGEVLINIPNDGYIYVPYSQLDFCYKTTSNENYTATEEVCYYDNKSYAIAPKTVDPTALIQFIAIPPNAQVEIDESGLIVNKNYTYVMTVKEWNDNINSKYYYQFLPKYKNDGKRFIEAQIEGYEMETVGNMAAYYEGYLDKVGDIEVLYGKKISITDRTEVNITDDIDQYVTVYNQKYDSDDLKDLYVNPDGLWEEVDGIEYRVCSKTETRQVVPQLARNYLQNGTKIKTTNGWEPCKIFAGNENIKSYFCSTLQLRVGTTEKISMLIDKPEYVTEPEDTFLEVLPSQRIIPLTTVYNNVRRDIYTIPFNTSEHFDYYNTVINFGIIGQEKKIVKDTIYCLGIKIGLEEKYRIESISNPMAEFYLRIGEGRVVTNGEYDIACPSTPIDITENNGICISLANIATYTGESKEIRVKSTDTKETETKIIDIYEGYIFIKFDQNINNPYYAITARLFTSTRNESGTYEGESYNQVVTTAAPKYYLFNTYLFEAYTKGIDQFEAIIAPAPEYRYSGRELYDLIFKVEEGHTIEDTTLNCSITDIYDKVTIHSKVIFEEDIMSGSVYEYQKYFIQQLIAYDVDKKTGVRTGKKSIADTFAQKEILNNYADLINFKNTNISCNDLPYSSAQFSNDDIDISTKYIDLNKCKYYNKTSNKDMPDCNFEGEHLCLYQKYGYCPYLFQTEKHCRKIRTLKGEKSNRFNLTQELSKIFEMYPVYWTEHYDNGKIKTDLITDEEGIEYEKARKNIFYIKEKGMENKLGFRYEKNLSSISRDIKSDQIVTKLYVDDVDSELSKTGLCSIKTAEDNPSKDSFIIDFRYYTTKGILDKDTVNADLYGKGEGDYGYLKQLGYFNNEYDKLANSIINLSTSSFNELQANIEANVTGIETAQAELFKIKKNMTMYESKGDTAAEVNKQNQSYQNQVMKYNEQLNILNNLIYETFFDQVTNQYLDISLENNLTPQPGDRAAVVTFFDKEHDIKWMQNSSWFKQHTYNLGMLGQYNREYLQIAEWKKKQAQYLKEINKLALKFFQKYESYLKEGTWADSNYISDNAYYFGACEVAAESAIPKVSYNINVVDLYALPGYEDYKFNIADTTYVEDIGMFGINKITGLPNRLKVLISGITYDFDQPLKNNIQVQNFTTQFADLFQQITASVQSLAFNENIYKRASNFTSNQNITQESLQGTLDTNEMQLIKTDETNIEINKTGQSGSDINNHNNKYRLDGQGLWFSNNGGETWAVGVGPGGINADYINVGTLDAGKIRIVDNNYLYFLWDKNGISAFRDPQSLGSSDENLTFDYYALFNRYGLSLVEKGLIRLRAGYNFNGDLSGDNKGKINTESVQGKEIGFFLYDDRGIPIFRTNTQSLDSEEENLTARLSLKGEIYVSDSDIYSPGGEATSWVYSNSYQFSRINVYNLATIVEFPIEIDYLNITVEEFDFKWCANYLNYHILNGDIPVDTDWEDNSLIVTDLNGVHEVKVERLEQSGTDSYLKDNEYYINNAIYSLKTYICMENPYGGEPIRENSDVYIKEDYIYQRELQEILYCSFENINPSAIESSNTLYNLMDKVGYIQEQGQNIIQLTTLTSFYYKNDVNYGFINQTEQQSPVQPITGAAGLYINNKIALEDQISGDQRLFCCAKDENSISKNIFSIKKDGSLYMGGDLYDKDGNALADSSKITDEIQVKNADIWIERGTMHLDFHKIVDKDGTPLDESITDAVASIKLIRHRHEIKEINGQIIPEGNFAYLPTEKDLLVSTINLPGPTQGKTVLEHLLYIDNTGAYSNLHQAFEMFFRGQYTIVSDHGASQVIQFSNKVPLADESYTINCENTYTEYTGSGSEGGGGSAVSIETYGLLDPGYYGS